MTLRYVEALNRALHELMAADERVLLIGEDVLDPYGGAFRVARGLSTAYPDRVLTTPISEAAIVGVGTGLRCGDAADRRDHVRRLPGPRRRPDHQPRGEVPLDVRRPGPRPARHPDTDGGAAGLRPTHSQTLEQMFLGVPGSRSSRRATSSTPAACSSPR